MSTQEDFHRPENPLKKRRELIPKLEYQRTLKRKKKKNATEIKSV